MPNRRSFLKNSMLTVIAVTPAIQKLSKIVLLADLPDTKLIKYAFRLTNWKNLLNVDFYFIGAKLASGKMVVTRNERAYMIVRLPQQHIAEQAIDMAAAVNGCEFTEPTDEKIGELIKEPAITRISGYSYLAFEIEVPINNQRLELSITEKELMAWDADYFKLVGEDHSGGSKESILKQNSYPFNYKNNGGDFAYDFDGVPKKNEVPITAIEAPWRLILSPQLARKNQDVFSWHFSAQPLITNQQIESELWSATLSTTVRPGVKETGGNSDDPLKKHFEGIELAIIGSPDYGATGTMADQIFKVSSPTKKITSRTILPQVKDRQDLVELYIKYGLIARSKEITFTSLGINVYLEFSNDHISDIENKISLVSWKQLISFGRDEEVEVVRLLLDKEAGHKFLHVKTTKSRTKSGVTYLDYREYIMPFDLEIDYRGHIAENGVSQYESPFSKLKLRETAPKRICPLESPSYKADNKLKLESGGTAAYTYYPLTYNKNLKSTNALVADSTEVLKFEYEATDWAGKTFIIKKAIQAIQLEVNDVLVKKPDLFAEVNKFFDREVTVANELMQSVDSDIASIQRLINPEAKEQFDLYKKRLLGINAFSTNKILDELLSKYRSNEALFNEIKVLISKLFVEKPKADPRLYFAEFKTQAEVVIKAITDNVKDASKIYGLGEINKIKDKLQESSENYENLLKKIPTGNGAVQLIATMHGKAVALKSIEKGFKNIIECQQQKIDFAILENQEQTEQLISNLRCDYVMFTGSLRKLDVRIDFFNNYPSMPKLQKAQVYVDSLSKLVNDQVPIEFKYAKSYIDNWIDKSIANPSKVFAEVTTQSREYLKGRINEVAKEFGGYLNPEMPVDFITYLKDPKTIPKALTDELASRINVGAYVDQIQNGYNDLVFMSEEVKKNLQLVNAINPKDYFQGLKAKILGSISLQDILGTDFELPRLVQQPDKVVYNFSTNKFKPSIDLGMVTFTAVNKFTTLQLYMEKSTKVPNQYKSFTKLSNFSIGINMLAPNALLIKFKSLEFTSSNSQSSKTHVQIDDVGFGGPLAFFGKLADSLKLPGTGLKITPSLKQIGISYNFAIPSIEGGAFNFSNLKFGIGVNIPLPSADQVEPIGLLFNINAPEDKFLITVGIFGGRGHFVMDATPQKIRSIDAGLEFGGYLGLNLGIAKGNAYLFAGIRYVKSGEAFTLAGYLICGGGVTVFGFISVSVVFSMSLIYQNTGSLFGTAAVSYSVRVGFFKKSFTLRYSKQISGDKGKPLSADPTASARVNHRKEDIYYAYEGETMDLIDSSDLQFLPPPNPNLFKNIYKKDDWKIYCNAFKF